MAGGKETPRQKMIGMMYLVLTAMLALQVSSAIIEKFILLNSSLEVSSAAVNQLNSDTQQKIKAAVEKSGNRAADVAILKQAEDVRQQTAGIMSELDALKKEIIEFAGGGYNEEGAIKNPSEETKVGELMIGGNKNGKAYELKEKLNAFVSGIEKYSDHKFQPLALDGDEDPISKDNKDQRNKDFANLNFGETPVAAALAVLSQKQSDIRRIESEVLNYLASKVGAADIKFDRVLAMMSAESKVVVAGTKFKGQMFIAASASGLSPRMSLNGSPLQVVNGVGEIEFTAQGGEYNSEGLSRRTLQGVITIPTPSGKDTTYRLEEEFFVARPTYQIETGTMPPLYFGCANKLSIQSPSLGALWSPSFSADGAEVINNGKGKITVVPNKAQVSLTIANQGNTLGTEPFKVNRVPKPTLEIRVGGRPVNTLQGESASAVRSIQVVAIPDEGFKNYSPDDANFRVSSIEVSLARGTRRIAGPLSLANGGGSINSLAAQAQPGDRYAVEVKGVQRRNFKGDVSNVEMGNVVLSIPLK
jgi:gliding motility-associated protein GldM